MFKTFGLNTINVYMTMLDHPIKDKMNILKLTFYFDHLKKVI